MIFIIFFMPYLKEMVNDICRAPCKLTTRIFQTFFRKKLKRSLSTTEIKICVVADRIYSALISVLAVDTVSNGTCRKLEGGILYSIIIIIILISNNNTDYSIINMYTLRTMCSRDTCLLHIHRWCSIMLKYGH